MRQPNNDMGRVQRQVTARPVATSGGPQIRSSIDPRANNFANGLASFVETAGNISAKRQQSARDAQALTADLGLRNYQQAFQAAWENDPAIRDNEEKRMQWDEDHRNRYFGEITDPELKGQVTQRLDSFLQGQLDVYATEKATAQRLELGSQSMLASLEQVQSKVAAGEADLPMAASAVREYFSALSNSESFKFTPKQSEEVILTLAEKGGREAAIILGEAYGTDESLSVETQLFLRAQRAEAEALTTMEKEAMKSRLYRQWEGEIERGRLTWDATQEFVDSGVITASDQRSLMRRQQQRMERKVEDNTFRNAVVSAMFRDPNEVDPSVLGKLRLESPTEYNRVKRELRQHFENNGALESYFQVLTAAGETDQVTQELATRAFASSNRQVSADEELPEFVSRMFNNEFEAMWRGNSLFTILPPDLAYRVATMKAGVELLGLSEKDAYNLAVDDNAARMLDIPRPQLLQFQERLAQGDTSWGWFRNDTWQIDGNTPQGTVGALSAIAMQLVKSGRYSDEQAIEWVREQHKKSTIGTEYGPVPRAIFGAYGSDDEIRNRIDFYGRQQAEANGLDPSDLRMRFTNDGSVLLMSPDQITPIGYAPIQSIQAPANVPVGGQPSIQRQLDDQQRDTQDTAAKYGSQSREARESSNWQNATDPSTVVGPYGF